MCDYSLEHTASRPAKVGDELVTSRFRGTTTHGFAAVGEPEVAVCLLPGTEIAFEHDICYQGFWRTKVVRRKTAIFCRVNEHQPYTLHDALELPGGTVMMLGNVVEGQRARVLQLPVTAAHSKAVDPSIAPRILERRELR